MRAQDRTHAARRTQSWGTTKQTLLSMHLLVTLAPAGDIARRLAHWHVPQCAAPRARRLRRVAARIRVRAAIARHGTARHGRGMTRHRTAPHGAVSSECLRECKPAGGCVP